MSYAGIDYGLGMANFDKTNGIRFGVISTNSVDAEYLYENQELDYPPSTCPDCGNELVTTDSPDIPEDAEWITGKELACVTCETCYWSDELWDGGESNGWSYERDGYVLMDCLVNDIFIIKSPYFTYAQYCSPCVPGAGNLDSPVDEGTGAKCYCLGAEWFTEDDPCPYPIWSVKTGERL
jgi:hypothetical protein